MSRKSFLDRRHARRERQERRQRDESTALDRLYGTEFESFPFPVPEQVDEQTAVASLRFVLRHARELFLAGAETQAIDAAVIAITARWRMDNVSVDITSRTVQAQYAPEGVPPLVMMTVTGSEDSRDLDQLDQLHALTRHILREDMAPSAAERALNRIISRKGIWPWWTSVLGGALLAAMLCVLASGTLKAALVSPLVFVVSNRVSWALGKSGLQSFYVTSLQTACAIGSALLLADARVLTGGEAASVAAANVVILLPILSLVSMVEDAISGFRSMASGRIISVGLFFAAIVGGVFLVGFLLRHTDPQTQDTAFRTLPLAATLLTSAIGSLGNAVFMGGPPRLLPWAVAGGVIAGFVNNGTQQLLHQPTPVATLTGAAVLGAAAGAVAPTLRLPARSLVVPGIAGALLPGPDVYRSLVQAALHVSGAGAYALIAFVATAAIGVGSVLGSSFGNAAQREWRPRTRTLRGSFTTPV
ncbi:threonine/serine exporter family protein [Streptomyces anulatus]